MWARWSLSIACLMIDAVGRGVLADHQQFAHACFDQLFRLTDHGMGGARLQAAAHVGDDAELAFVVTALGNLQIAVVARRQADARGGQQVDERIGLRRHGGVNGIKNRFVLMRAGDGQNARVRAGDEFGVGPKAAGHDDAAVFGQSLADRFQGFRPWRTVEKTAGVDDDGIGTGIVGADRIAFGAQAGQDAFAIDQRLGAAKADHADGGLTFAAGIRNAGAGKIGAKVGRVLRHRADIAVSAGQVKGGEICARFIW